MEQLVAVTDPHARSPEELAARLGVDPRRGLDADDAARRLQVYGRNELAAKAKASLVRRFLNQFRNVMIVILLLAAGLSGVMGELHDTIVILVIVILNAIIGSVQEYRAERAIDALRKMTSSEIRVRRNGHQLQIADEALVPGDIVYLEAGNVVAGDIRLLKCVDLEIDEASLTGESLPVAKNANTRLNPECALGDRLTMAFKGTHVTRGHATGITVATGADTELGRVAGLIESAADTQTPLQVRLARFGRRLAVVVLAISLVVFASGLLRGEPWLLMLLTAVSLAVAAIPEALPAVISISLAIGARKMSHRNAVMRRLSAVETLGSVTYICADKTGTLTRNEMRLEIIHAAGREVGSLAEAGDGEALWTLLGHAMALNNDVVRNGDHSPRGDPTEIALYLGALEADYDRDELERRHPRLAEVPFHAERRIMSTLNQMDDHVLVVSKGAPESLLLLCRDQLGSDGKMNIDADALLQKSDELAQRGYRVLAFAIRSLDAVPADISSNQVERDMTFLALVGLIDPPRDEVRQAIRECSSAGITPVMITGDHPGTALAIAEQLGIQSPDGVRTGTQLDELSDEDLLACVQSTRIYARVSPEQKIRIVRALQQLGEYVAMTGDGVNDAPALKQADIGVAMGLKGTDVARESSDMVLKDDNFATIVGAVREGRRIFDNIKKFIKYTMTSNAGEIWTIFMAPFLGMPLPLLPIQILWINLVTDGLPGLALSAEPGERGIMRRPPRPPDESIFAHGTWQRIIWIGMLIGGLSLGAQAWAYHGGSQNWQTIVFTVLTLCQLMNAMMIRSDHESIFTLGLASNLPLLATVLLTTGLHLLVVYLPLFNDIFNTTPLTPGELAVCFVLPLVVLVASEIEKWLIRRGRLYRSAAPETR